MTFVNEHIPFGSDAANRLGLPELMQRFGRHEDFMYWITIDRERNIYFIRVQNNPGKDPSPEDFRLLYMLNINGFEVLVRLGGVDGKGLTMLRWQLYWIGADLEHSLEMDDPRRAEAITVLKEALQVFGSRGELDVSPNFRAEFEF